jgi:hypothetical protein
VAFQREGEARVVIPEAGRATLELANPAQRRMIDQIEVRHDTVTRIRVAFEVDDTATVATELAAAGATEVAPPTETRWRSLDPRLDGPAGLHLTLFQELESPAEPAHRSGFGTAAVRDAG